MEILNDQSLEQINALIESSGDEGITIRELVKSEFPDYDDSILSSFAYVINGKKANIKDVVMPGQKFSIIPRIAGGFF